MAVEGLAGQQMDLVVAATFVANRNQRSYLVVEEELAVAAAQMDLALAAAVVDWILQKHRYFDSLRLDTEEACPYYCL